MRKLSISLLVAGVGGCASFHIPPEKLEHSEGSIRGAEEAGATSVPTAKLHLQLAKDQAERAKSMAENGDEDALLMLARAESDAELAIALAREAAVHKEALQAAEDLKEVKSNVQ